MKVCITGSAGFIGSNLVEACLRKDWSVLGVDNFAGSDRKMALPERYSNDSKYSFREADILNTELMKELFKDVDVVFHLAALPRVSFSTDYPLESNKNNITGTLSVLEAARRVGVKRVVYSASSSMYGGEDIPFPTPETTPAHPRSNYALQKYVGAEYCRLYSELYGLDTAVLLYFNVLGKYQFTGGAYSTVIPAFFHAALNGSCRIDGDGLQSRDLCHIDNVVDANILAAESDKKFCGDRFNIACGETHSVLDVYEQVRKLTGLDVKKHHVKPRLGDPRKSHADISKARKILGYEPKVKFAAAMEKTADWWLNGCKI